MSPKQDTDPTLLLTSLNVQLCQASSYQDSCTVHVKGKIQEEQITVILNDCTAYVTHQCLWREKCDPVQICAQCKGKPQHRLAKEKVPVASIFKGKRPKYRTSESLHLSSILLKSLCI